VVGAPQAPFSIHAFSLIMARKSVAGSLIGGIPEVMMTTACVVFLNFRCALTKLVFTDFALAT